MVRRARRGVWSEAIRRPGTRSHVTDRAAGPRCLIPPLRPRSARVYRCGGNVGATVARRRRIGSEPAKGVEKPYIAPAGLRSRDINPRKSLVPARRHDFCTGPGGGDHPRSGGECRMVASWFGRLGRTPFAVPVAVLAASLAADRGNAAPMLLDPNLQVQTVASGINQPTSMAFIGSNDFLVLEKATGQVRRVTNSVVQAAPVLDLAVNNASERGLLGIALQPDFASSGGVYLFWTESSTGTDSGVTSAVPLLGNRVDRFTWNGTNLVFDSNVARLRAVQADAGQSEQANHNGGPIAFGPDGKLYVMVGDVGRRGQMQNLPNGPSGGADDQFGGPQPDNAHLTGVVLRLNPDGSTPADNPFFAAGAAVGGEVGSNIQKVYSYGVRNSFGLAFDPVSGALWASEDGDDSFDEINRVTAGSNGGWVQIAGPVARVAEYKSIETTAPGGLQQIRWPATNIADVPADALAALYVLPGSTYSDPEFSWRYPVSPAGIGFLDGDGLGAAYAGNLFVGAATASLEGGYLYRFALDAAREGLAFTDAALADLVADNFFRNDGTESESLLFGTGFGVGTYVVTGPDGRLYVVSLSNGEIYAISAIATGGTAVSAPPAAILFVLALAGLFALRRRAPARMAP
ncbi:MAG: sorbosone dehydrogenase family protein [Rhodospirillaceae bacterium]